MKMTVQIVDDGAQVALIAADIIARQVMEKPDSTLLVATGQTPMATYAQLIRLSERGEVDFRRAWAIQLDEYQGLTPDDPRSLAGWMKRAFVQPLHITQVVELQQPEAYDQRIAERGGIDLAILGLGPNGHLGFNEPPSAADAPTRLISLSAASLESNRAYWGDQPVPERALTAGMSTILQARHILLLVTGAHKRDILLQALHGPETAQVPASYLRRAKVTVVADRDAWTPA